MKYSAGQGVLGCSQGQGTKAAVSSPGTHPEELGENSAYSTVTYQGEGLQPQFLLLRAREQAQAALGQK